MNRNRFSVPTFKSNVDDEEIVMAEPEYKTGKYLETIDDTIFFYSDVDRDEILQLNKEIRRVGNEQLYKQILTGHKKTDPVKLRINTYGGVIFSGLAAVDEIRNCKAKVTTIIDGCCASAGTLMSVVGHTRLMNKHSWILIHQISSGLWGTYENFNDEMENQNKLMAMIKGIYLKYTKIPEKVLNTILKHDLWLDADTCLKYGIIDKII